MRGLIYFSPIVLGKDPEKSDKYWKVDIKKKINHNYENTLTEEEQNEEYPLNKNLSLRHVFTVTYLAYFSTFQEFFGSFLIFLARVGNNGGERERIRIE